MGDILRDNRRLLVFIMFSTLVMSIGFHFFYALTTYSQKIAMTREEITSNLAVEQAIQHIAVITVPIIGGTVWEVYGSRAPFLFGVGIVLIGLVLAQRMRTAAEPWPLATGGN